MRYHATYVEVSIKLDLLYYNQEKLFGLTLFTTIFYLLSASLNTDGSYVWYCKNYLVKMTTSAGYTAV